MPTTVAGGEVLRSQGKQSVWALTLGGGGPKAGAEGPEYFKRSRPNPSFPLNPHSTRVQIFLLSVAACANFETPVSRVVFQAPFDGASPRATERECF